MRSLALLLILAGPAGAVDIVAPASADLSPARAAIAAGDWEGAVALLLPIAQGEPGNADAFNLLGYASRNAGELAAAEGYYRAALIADPDHLGALEYQGELFLLQGDRAGAEANLSRLRALCGACEEAEDLAAALAGS